MLSAIKKRFTGADFPQEYLCLATEEYLQPFRIEIESTKLDISNKHMMLGYSPLLIGIPLTSESNSEMITLNFLYDHKVIAFIRMKKINVLKAGSSVLNVYEGDKAEHSFIPKLGRFLIGARQYFRSLKKGNIRLKGNIYDQVRVAYSVPREISIVTTGTQGYYNIFPTDLHGRINDEYYADSLRTNGRAGKQVEESGRMVLSRIDAAQYMKAYSLGKNHNAELKPITPVGNMSLSEKFELPIPEGALSYFELERIAGEGFEKGIHKVHIFRIINEKILKQGNYLAHIHNYAAAWRERNGIKTEYLYR